MTGQTNPALPFGLLAGALLVAACASPPPTKPVESVERPSILLFLMDAVRADRLSAYGYERPTTPMLEALAARGVLFEDVTAPSAWTPPSHASLFTGEPPWVHGVHLMNPGEPGSIVAEKLPVGRMREDLPTLAGQLTAAGYRTVSFSQNPWLDHRVGIMRGFEVVRVIEDTAELLAAVHAELARPQDRPLFLFVNVMAAHAPYYELPTEAGFGDWGLEDPSVLDPATAPEWVRPYLTSQPRGVNFYLEHEPGVGSNGFERYAARELEIPPDGLRLLESLYEAGIVRDDYLLHEVCQAWWRVHPSSIVAATSDHGEAFGEHGQLEHRVLVYPEYVKIPLVMAGARWLPEGLRVSTPVQLQDLHDTLLDLAGLEQGGASLVPTIRGAASDRPPVFSAIWPDFGWGLRLGGRFRHPSVHYRVGADAVICNEGIETELYDLTSDPGMTRDLSSARPERVRVLEEEAGRLLALMKSSKATPAELSPEELERLRSLGYLR